MRKEDLKKGILVNHVTNKNIPIFVNGTDESTTPVHGKWMTEKGVDDHWFSLDEVEIYVEPASNVKI